MDEIHAVIIEDNKEMTTFLKDILEDQHIVAFSAHTGSQGLKIVDKITPELVLLDLNLPDIDGQTLCKKMKQNHPKIKIIMITAQGTAQDVAAGLNLGADDYLPKPINEAELIARIKARFRQTKHNKNVLQIHDLQLNQTDHSVKRDGKNIQLSAQEFRLLAYLMKNQERVLTREMILSRIWRGNPDIETRVVDVYIGYLRKKIDFKKPYLIHTVRGFGYILKKK